jgi:hypothetical protein
MDRFKDQCFPSNGREDWDMSDLKKLPPAEGSHEQKRQPPAEGRTSNTQTEITSMKVGKLSRMLSVFASGMKLNTFQAKEEGDTCLHSTISDLQVRYGISFTREWEWVENRFGTQTRVLRYWLEGENLEKSKAVIGGGSQQ